MPLLRPFVTSSVTRSHVRARFNAKLVLAYFSYMFNEPEGHVADFAHKADSS